MVVTFLPQKATKFLHEQVTYQYNTDKPIHERKSLMTNNFVIILNNIKFHTRKIILHNI